MQALFFLLSLYNHRILTEARSACDAVDIFYLIDIPSIYEERKLVKKAILSVIGRGSNEDSSHSVMIYGDNVPVEIPDVLISIDDTYNIHRRGRQKDKISAKLDHAFDVIINAFNNPSNTKTKQTSILEALSYGIMENKPQRVDTNKMRYGANVGIHEDDDIVLIFDYYNTIIDERTDQNIIKTFDASKDKNVRFILGDTQSLPQPFEASYYFQLDQIKRINTERERLFSTTCPARIIIDEQHGYDLEVGNHVQYINDSTIDSCHLQFIDEQHPSLLNSATSFIYVFDYLDDDTRDTFQENDILIADPHTHSLIQQSGCRLAVYYIISIELHQNQIEMYNRNILKVFVGSVSNPMQYITKIKFIDDTEISQTEFDKTTDFGPNAQFNHETRRILSFANIPRFKSNKLLNAFNDKINNAPKTASVGWGGWDDIFDHFKDIFDQIREVACAFVIGDSLERRRLIHDVIIGCLSDSEGCGQALLQRRRLFIGSVVDWVDSAADDVGDAVGDVVDVVGDCFSDPIECGEDIYEDWFMGWLRNQFENAAEGISTMALRDVENSPNGFKQCILQYTGEAQKAVQQFQGSFITLQGDIALQQKTLNESIRSELLLAKDDIESKLLELGESIEPIETATATAIQNISTILRDFEVDIQLKMKDADQKFNEISVELTNIIILANKSLEGFMDEPRRLAWYHDLLDTLVDAFEVAVDGAKETALAAIREAEQQASETWGGITTELRQLRDDIEGVIDDANTKVDSWVTNAVDDIRNAYPTLGEVGALVQEMEDAVINAGSEITDWANTAAQSIQQLTDVMADAAKVLQDIATALAELLGLVGTETAEHIESFKWFEDHTLEETVSVSKEIGLVTIEGSGSITINYGASMEAELILYLNLDWDVTQGHVGIEAYLHGSLEISAYADITFNADLNVFLGETLKWWPPEKVIFAGPIPILWRPWFIMDITANTVPIDIEIFAGIQCNYFASFKVGFDASISSFGIPDGVVVNEIMEMSATEPGFDNICEPTFVYDNAVSECGFALGFDFNIDARIGLDIYSYFSTYIHGIFGLPFRINLPEMNPIQCDLPSANNMCSENPLKASIGATVEFSVKYAYEWNLDEGDLLAIFESLAVVGVDVGNDDIDNYLMNEYNLFDPISINMVIACLDIPGDVINDLLRQQCECGDVTIHPSINPTQSPTQVSSNPSPLPTISPTVITPNPSTSSPSYSPTIPTLSPSYPPNTNCWGCNGGGVIGVDCSKEDIGADDPSGIGSNWLCEFSPSLPSQMCADGYTQCSDTVKILESSSDTMTWEKGKDYCFGMNMELARIETEQEYNLALQYIQNRSISWVWIGLNDKNLVDEYRWSDGTLAKDVYGINSFGYPIPNGPWYDDEPNYSNDDCIFLQSVFRTNRDDTIGYRDYPCWSKYIALCSKTQVRCCDASHVPTQHPTVPTMNPTPNTHCHGCLNGGEIGVGCDIYYEDCFPGYGCFDESYHCLNEECADGYDAIGPYLDAFVCSKPVGKVLYPISCSHDDWYSFNTVSSQCSLAQIENEDDFKSAITAASAILHLGVWIGLQDSNGDNTFTYSDSTSASNAYGIRDDGTAFHGRGPWKLDQPILDSVGCVGIDKFDNKYSTEPCDSDKIGGALCQKTIYSSQWVLIESKEMDAPAASYICKANGMKLAQIKSMQQVHLASRLCGDFDCWIGMYYDARINRLYWFSNVDERGDLIEATDAFGVHILNATILSSSGIWELDEMPEFTDVEFLKPVYITKSTYDKTIYKPIEWTETKSHVICMANAYQWDQWDPNKSDSSLCSGCEFYGYIGEECVGYQNGNWICTETAPPTSAPSTTAHPTAHPSHVPSYSPTTKCFGCNEAIDCIEEDIDTMLCEFSPSLPSQICTDGYTQCSDTEKIFESSSDTMTWTQAKDYCFGINMELARIENEQEYNVALQHVQDRSISFVWIGLDDIDLVDEYRWSDGTIARDAYGIDSFGYPIPNGPWIGDEPNSVSQDCVFIQSTPMYTGYRDYYCHNKYIALCSKTQARCCDAYVNNNESWDVVTNLNTNIMLIMSLVMFAILSFIVMILKKTKRKVKSGYNVVSQKDV